ncbi:MAG: FapA family protein, partial [Desulfotomaculaceae bacterium]|nr:FapA family protein [Desulfotomaculaceae bacterium]
MTENIGTANNNQVLGPGGVWVKGGKVYVKDLDADSGILTVTPCEGVELVINGEVATGRTIVREKDEIVLNPLVVEEPGSYGINVAPDCLSVKLEIILGTITSYSIVDAGPEINLSLKTVTRADKKRPCAPADILQGLSEKNITYGIKHAEIKSILDREKDGCYLIAEGEAPGETVNDRVELKFNAGQDGQKISDTSDKINFRDLGEILSVEPGILLAEKFVGHQGKPGRKVSGEMILQPKPVPCDIIAGKGVEISADRCKIISKISGRPVAKRLGKGFVIDVDPVLHKKGDVDIQSGNIRFKGDVVVHGNVCEGMTVQAV